MTPILTSLCWACAGVATNAGSHATALSAHSRMDFKCMSPPFLLWPSASSAGAFEFSVSDSYRTPCPDVSRLFAGRLSPSPLVGEGRGEGAHAIRNFL